MAAHDGQPATTAVHGLQAPVSTAMPADHPPFLHGRTPAEAQAQAQVQAQNQAPVAAGNPADAEGGSVAGTITLADKLKDKAASGSAIFLVARSYFEGGASGPVLAVQRYTVGSWPLPFSLTQDNVMLAGMHLSGKVVLTARVDQDGDAMTKQVGDIEGTSPPISVPAQNVKLVLDTVRAQAAGAPSPPGLGESAMPPGHPALPAEHPM